jgi:hypothetical protein
MLGLVFVASCSDEETYADQVDRERKAINKYIADSAVTVISEDEFAANNYTTDTAKNEWVLFESSGVYMQIVRKGTGEQLKDGETATVLCRYTERNLLTDSITASNMNAYYAGMVDKMSVTDNSGSFTGYFVSGSSSLMNIYQSSSTAVPEGWLLPLSYIKLGRQSTEEGEIAKVRLIVPHEMGYTSAIYNVTPCLYDITYERGR